jgi:hypothetical protein
VGATDLLPGLLRRRAFIAAFFPRALRKLRMGPRTASIASAGALSGQLQSRFESTLETTHPTGRGGVHTHLAHRLRGFLRLFLALALQLAEPGSCGDPALRVVSRRGASLPRTGIDLRKADPVPSAEERAW